MRTTSEIKQDIQDIQDAIDVTDNKEELSALKSGLKDLQDELNKAKESENNISENNKKAAEAKKKADQEAAQKAETEKKQASDKRKENIGARKEVRKLRKEITSFTHKGKKVTVPDMKVKDKHEIAPGVHLIKMADNTYVIQEKDNKWSEMEIQKESEGKWTVTCRTKDNKTFKSLGDAVTHVVTILTKEVYKEKIEKANKDRKARAELKKHPVTPAETLSKVADTIENKLEEKKPTKSQFDALVKQYLELGALIRKWGKEFGFKVLKSAKKMEDGGGVNPFMEYAYLEIGDERKNPKQLAFVHLKDEEHAVGSDGEVYQILSLKEKENPDITLAYHSQHYLYNYAEDTSDFEKKQEYKDALKIAEEYMEDRGDIEEFEDESRDEADFENDIVIADVRNGYSFSAEGRFISEYDDFDEALEAANKWMNKNKYYPTIWYVNERGNYHAIDNKGNEIKGTSRV